MLSVISLSVLTYLINQAYPTSMVKHTKNRINLTALYSRPILTCIKFCKWLAPYWEKVKEPIVIYVYLRYLWSLSKLSKMFIYFCLSVNLLTIAMLSVISLSVLTSLIYQAYPTSMVKHTKNRINHTVLYSWPILTCIKFCVWLAPYWEKVKEPIVTNRNSFSSPCTITFQLMIF